MNDRKTESINQDMHVNLCTRCFKPIPNSALISQNMLCETCYNETNKNTDSPGLSDAEKRNLGTKEISKRIRNQLKKDFPGCVFSVVMERYSMGSSITVSLMKADRKIIKDYKDIKLDNINLGAGYTPEDIQKRQEEDHFQLNKYTLREDFNPLSWCNGVFLTREGHELLKKIVAIANQYNYDHSDPMTDYHSVNYHFDLCLGKWNIAFKDGTCPVSTVSRDKQTPQTHVMQDKPPIMHKKRICKRCGQETKSPESDNPKFAGLCFDCVVKGEIT